MRTNPSYAKKVLAQLNMHYESNPKLLTDMSRNGAQMKSHSVNVSQQPAYNIYNTTSSGGGKNAASSSMFNSGQNLMKNFIPMTPESDSNNHLMPPVQTTSQFAPPTDNLINLKSMHRIGQVK